MSSPDVALAAVGSLIQNTAADSSLTEVERSRRLRALRSDLIALQGQCDTLLAQAEQSAQAGVIGLEERRVAARERANVRASLLASGEATLEELDAAGFLSNEQLDELTNEGTLDNLLERLKPGDGPSGAELYDRWREAQSA